MLLLPISQGVYSSSVTLFLVPGGGEYDNNLKSVFTRPVILLLIFWKGEGDNTLCPAGGVHRAWDIVPNIHGGDRLMLLPKWQRVYIHLGTLFLIFRCPEVYITPSIADTVQPYVILFLISGRGDDGINPHTAGGEHKLCDISESPPTICHTTVTSPRPVAAGSPMAEGVRH